MRRYGLYDATRGLTTLAAAGAAGVLLWAATLVGQRTDGRFWAEMGIVAGAGLVMAISQVIGYLITHNHEDHANAIGQFVNRRDFGGGQLVANQRGQILDRAALHPGRDFLRQQFKEQFTGHRDAPYTSFRGAAQRRARNPYSRGLCSWIPGLALRAIPE